MRLSLAYGLGTHTQRILFFYIGIARKIRSERKSWRENRVELLLQWIGEYIRLYGMEMDMISTMQYIVRIFDATFCWIWAVLTRTDKVNIVFKLSVSVRCARVPMCLCRFFRLRYFFLYLIMLIKLHTETFYSNFFMKFNRISNCVIA